MSHHYHQSELYLSEIFESCKNKLLEGAQSAENSFHFPVLGTLNHHEIELRTVVLRQCIANPLSLIFYTDYRSPKITQLKRSNHVSWLFYDPKTKVQIRIKAKATLHHDDEISELQWNKLRTESRKDYDSIYSPSTIVEDVDDILNLKLVDEALIYQNFTVVSSEVLEIDYLILDQSGNKRARFLKEESGFIGQWMVP